MKFALLILFFTITSNTFSQKSTDFSHVDWNVLSVEAAAPDTLAHWLTSRYRTDLEKARAIFRWITENISYKSKGPYKGPFKPVKYLKEDTEDTSTVLKTLDERVAELVLMRKLAVCDGYARLFKTLCNYAGLKSEVITGFARTGAGEKYFRSNHRWNAVMIDSTWHLLDVTWASGYSTYSSDDFIKRFNDYYFLTPPKNFIQDHYPEKVEWTLLKETHTPREFNLSPLKYQGLQKFKITSFYPQKGVIEAYVGDTLRFAIEGRDAIKPFVVTDSLVDSLPDIQDIYQKPVFLKSPLKTNYIVTSETAEWLYIIYNDVLIMRYKLNVLRKKAPMPS